MLQALQSHRDYPQEDFRVLHNPLREMCSVSRVTFLCILVLLVPFERYVPDTISKDFLLYEVSFLYSFYFPKIEATNSFIDSFFCTGCTSSAAWTFCVI